MATQVISTELERLSYGGPAGSIQTGVHRQVISESGATRTLLADEAGALCTFDKVDGQVYTLPTPVAGMEFEFAATASVTSNTYKVITKTVASQFLVGGVNSASLTAGANDFFVADGTTHVAIAMGATTTGGLVGGHVRFRALSSTQWLVTGGICGSGTLADPFATS